jgi:hypothetical protein
MQPPDHTSEGVADITNSRATKRHCSGLPAYSAGRPLNAWTGGLGVVEDVDNQGFGCAPVNLVSQDSQFPKDGLGCSSWGLNGASGAAAAAATAAATHPLAPQGAAAAHDSTSAGGSGCAAPGYGVEGSAAYTSTVHANSSSCPNLQMSMKVKDYLESSGYLLLPGDLLEVLYGRVPTVRNMVTMMYQNAQYRYAFVVMSKQRGAMGLPTNKFGRLFIAYAPPGDSWGPLLSGLMGHVLQTVCNQLVSIASEQQLI